MIRTISCGLLLAALGIIFVPSTCGQSVVTISDGKGNTIYANGTVGWAPVPGGGYQYKTNTTYSEENLGILFAFARSFINTIQPSPIPLTLVTQLLNGDFDISQRYMELVNYALGLGICLVLGILFIIFLPLFGACFCCCRCCCNSCGGDMVQKYDSNAPCKRMGLGLGLFLMCLCMGVSAVCVYVTNGRFTVALKAVDESVGNNLDDIDSFLNNTIAQFTYLSKTMYGAVNMGVQRDLDAIGPLVGDPIVGTLLPKVDPAINSIIAMDSTIQNVMTGLQTVSDEVNDVKQGGVNLTNTLNDLSDGIKATQLKPGCLMSCLLLDASVFSMDVDFNAFPDLSSTINAMSSVASQNLTALAVSGRDVVLTLPNMITTSTASIRTSVKGTLNGFATMIEGMVDKFINQTVGAFSISTVKADVAKYTGMVKEYDTYRYYGGIGLMAVFCLICFCFLSGILLGVVGHDRKKIPTKRGSLSNCGGCCLMLGVTLIFLVGSILMLLTTITFVVGGNLEKICQPLLDLTLFKDFLDVGGIPSFNIGAMLLGNASIPFSLYNSFLGCRANQAPFTLMYFDTLIPLEDYMDYKKYLPNMDQQFSNMANMNMSGLTIITPATEQLLNDFKNSGAASINFTEFTDMLNQPLLAFNLSEFTITFEYIKNDCVSPAKDDWDYHIATLNYMQNSLIPAVENEKQQLKKALDDLQVSVNTIVPSVDNALSAAKSAQTALQNDALKAVANSTQTYLNRILNYIEQFKTKALYLVYNELAACRPVWNLYDSFSIVLCRYTVDALNAFWFGMGWGLLFFIPSLIVAVKLAAHYRKMKKAPGYKKVERMKRTKKGAYIKFKV